MPPSQSSLQSHHWFAFTTFFTCSLTV